MKKYLLPVLGAVLAGTPLLSAAYVPTANPQADPYRFARTVAPRDFGNADGRRAAAAALRAADPDRQITTDDVTFLEGPDGSVWYAVSSFDREFIQVNEHFTDNIIKGYTFTVYDSQFNEVGSIHDVVTLLPGESKPARVALDVTVTRKFFNSDNNYEVMVALILNKSDLSEMPYVNTRTKVYSIGGAKDNDGNDMAIATIPGYSIAAVNAAADAWSENFFISFFEEVAGNPDDFTSYEDYLASYKSKVTTYKKAGYSTPFAELSVTEIPMSQLPGDQSSSPFFFSCVKNGKPTFVESRYTKPLFLSPTDPTNEGLTPDNTLEVSVKQLSGSYNPTLEETAHVEIPCVQKSASVYTFYAVGNLGYTDDVDFEHFSTDGKAHYIVTVDDYSPNSDNYISSYYVYDSNGQRMLTLAEDTENFVFMSDVAGQQPQVMFIHNSGSDYNFDFVELYTGTTACSTGLELDGYKLTTAIDRVADATYGYLYAVSLQFTDTDADGNYIERVGWFNTDGQMVRVDEINLGKNLTLAKANITASALNPYVFNTDTDVEYMFLVKRRYAGATAVAEELVVAAPGKEPVFTATPDAEKGNIVNVSLINGDVNRLCVTYSRNDENSVLKYTQDIYDLPLTRFAGGDGTPENPYLIATPGDFAQIKAAPGACFSIVNDLDFTGFEYKSIGAFSGVLDGNGKKIKGLTINGAAGTTGMFGFAEFGSAIRNLVVVEPTLNLAANTGSSAIIAGTAQNTAISDIVVVGAKVIGAEFSDNFGIIAGRASNGAQIEQCYVAAADINLPESTVGGIAGNLLTGSAVTACAFTGDIVAGSTVGGIVADMAADAAVTDCHADATITAAHTIGGIAGTTARGKISRCHAEGSLTANAPTRWGGHAVGGIVGSINMPTEENCGVVVDGCLVTIASITTEGGEDFTPEMPGQLDTAHRIAGRTAANMEPEILGYDEEWNPIYGDPVTEPGLTNNYVAGNLAKIQDDIEASAATTEGADIDKYEVGYDFLSSLGYAFGTATNAPWAIASGFDPALHFETLLMLDNADIKANLDEPFTIDLTILARIVPEDIFGDFMAEFDESKINMTGNFSLDGKHLAIEMQAAEAGVHPFTITLLGSTVAGTVDVATSGIADTHVASDALTISFDGTTVSADAAISVFNLAGTLVAAGNGAVSVDHLAAGVYVVKAVAANGTSATRKIAK